MRRHYRLRFLLGAICLFIGIKAVCDLRNWWWRESVYSGLKQVCLAMHQYQDRWGQLPPVEWSNDLGATLSFRVLLMAHFESPEAKLVALQALTVKDAAELEFSAAYEKWRNTLEGQSLLGSEVEFVPVTGEWTSWGGPLLHVSNKKWNRESIPMVVAVWTGGNPQWCQAVKPAIAGNENIIFSRGFRMRQSLYVSCDCSVHNVELKKEERNR